MPFKKNSFFIIAALLLLFSFCKEPVINDSDLIPSNKLGVIVTDTLTIISEVVKEDPLRTDELAVNLLGNMIDPVFGKSNASVYFQLLLQTNNIDLGDINSLQLDSAVLMLQYAGSYGNTKTPQNLVVYELDETMFRDSDYFSDRVFQTKPNEIGRLNGYIPNFSDSITTRFEKYAPHLRIRLNDAWAKNIITQPNYSNLSSNELFLDFFKGLHVKAEENSGSGITYLDLKAPASALMFYYKSNLRDTVFTVVINADAATANNYKHDYSGSYAESALQPNRSGDSLVLIQSMAGLKTKISVPNIKNLGNISISKAELVLTNFKNSIDITSQFTIPGRLTLNAVDSVGKNAFLDDQFIGETYLGGERFQESNLEKTVNLYKFNTAVHFQNVISNQKEDYGIYILTFPSNRIADRLVAGGGNHSKYPMKLKLTYTKIE